MNRCWLLFILCIIFSTLSSVPAVAQTNPIDWEAGNLPPGAVYVDPPIQNPDPLKGKGVTTYKKTYTFPDVGAGAEAVAKAALKAHQDAIIAGMQRKAEEAVYKQRGLALDFLGKRIDLFKLTCKAGLDANGKPLYKMGMDFGKLAWKEFCIKNGVKNGALNCVLDQVLGGLKEKAMEELEKFASEKFCLAFTKFVNNQLTQCINIRFDIGSLNAGFPAMQQCLFGRFNLTVTDQGVSAGGEVLPTVIPNHSFKYSKPNKFPLGSLAGRESQLLGDRGAAALLDPNNWKKTQTIPATLAGTCDNPDPALVALLGSVTVDRNLSPDPNNPGSSRNITGDRNTGDGKEEKVAVAKWSRVYNNVSGSYEIVLQPGSASWTPNTARYSYLASCYGFDADVAAAACSTADKNSDFYKQTCVETSGSDGCCDPDTTDCVTQRIVHPADVCGQWVQGANGTSVCAQWAHRAGDVKICPFAADGKTPSCCNPQLNKCVELGLNVCDKYIEKKQCIAQTPENMKLLDPAYGNLPVGIRPRPNKSIDGKVCCTTEWCNLCPQDIIRAGAGKNPGEEVYMKNSEMANVPVYCKKTKTSNRTAGPLPVYDAKGNLIGGETNDKLATELVGVADQIFENTQEGCNLINNVSADGKTVDAARVFKLFIACPVSDGITDSIPILGSLITMGSHAINGCPSNTTIKSYLRDVVNNNKCYNLAEITRWPTPITKLPKIEGADPIGLCSNLQICAAAVPESENPYNPNGSLCKDAQGKIGACTGAPGETKIPSTGGAGTGSGAGSGPGGSTGGGGGGGGGGGPMTCSNPAGAYCKNTTTLEVEYCSGAREDQVPLPTCPPSDPPVNQPDPTCSNPAGALCKNTNTNRVEACVSGAASQTPLPACNPDPNPPVENDPTCSNPAGALCKNTATGRVQSCTSGGTPLPACNPDPGPGPGPGPGPTNPPVDPPQGNCSWPPGAKCLNIKTNIVERCADMPDQVPLPACDRPNNPPAPNPNPPNPTPDPNPPTGGGKCYYDVWGMQHCD